jgi:DNA-directed RNA polymerase subunit RPC12/RpoP
MTKQEFIKLNAEFVRNSRRRSFIVVGLGWAAIIAIIVGGIPLIKHLQQTGFFDRPELLKRYWFEGLFGCLLLALVVAASRVKQIFGVLCPNCGRRLFGISARLVVMIGNCAYCGEKVLNECE